MGLKIEKLEIHKNLFSEISQYYTDYRYRDTFNPPQYMQKIKKYKSKIKEKNCNFVFDCFSKCLIFDILFAYLCLFDNFFVGIPTLYVKYDAFIRRLAGCTKLFFSYMNICELNMQITIF